MKKYLLPILVILVLLSFAVFYFLRPTRYTTLFTEMNDSSLKKVTAILENSRIPFQIESQKSGKTIRIPESNINQFRMILGRIAEREIKITKVISQAVQKNSSVINRLADLNNFELDGLPDNFLVETSSNGGIFKEKYVVIQKIKNLNLSKRSVLALKADLGVSSFNDDSNFKADVLNIDLINL